MPTHATLFLRIRDLDCLGFRTGVLARHWSILMCSSLCSGSNSRILRFVYYWYRYRYECSPRFHGDFVAARKNRCPWTRPWNLCACKVGFRFSLGFYRWLEYFVVKNSKKIIVCQTSPGGKSQISKFFQQKMTSVLMILMSLSLKIIQPINLYWKKS